MHLKILLNQGAGLLKKWGWAWQVRAFQSSLYLFWAYWGGGDDGDMTMMIWRWRWWWWRCYWWYCWWWWQRWLQGCGGCRSHGVWPSSRRPRRRKRCCRLYLFLELYQYILDIFISLLLKAEPLAPVGHSVYRGETLGFCQEGVQVFHHHQLRVTSCLCGKIGQCVSAHIIRLFLRASLTVAMYQKCTAFSPHVSSSHSLKFSLVTLRRLVWIFVHYLKGGYR